MQSCGFKSHLPHEERNQSRSRDLLFFRSLCRGVPSPQGPRSPRHKCLVGRFDGKKVHRTFFYLRLTPSSAQNCTVFIVYFVVPCVLTEWNIRFKNSVKMFTLFYTSKTATGSFSGCMATRLWDYTFRVFSSSFRLCSTEYLE